MSSSSEDDFHIKGAADSSASSCHSGLSSPYRGAEDVSNLSEDNCSSPTSSPIQRRGLKRNLYANYKDSSKSVSETSFHSEKKRCEEEAHQAHSSSGGDENDSIPAINEEQGEEVEEEQAPQVVELVLNDAHSSPDSIINNHPCQNSPKSLTYSTDEEIDNDQSSNNSDTSNDFSDMSDISNKSSSDVSDFSNISSLDGLDSSDENISDHDDLFKDENKLYPGSVKSTDEAVLEVLTIYLKNNLSKSALRDILKFFTSSLPKPLSMPSTVHSLLKYVGEFCTPLEEVEHFYCRPAMHTMECGETSCNKCGSCDIGIFYEMPIASRLKYLFEYHGLADLIHRHSEARSGRGSQNICDIVDGSEYSRVWENVDNKYKVTLIMSTDGVRPHNSSKAKMWPLMFSIMEIPPHLRATFVWGIWFDKSLKPTMNLYLKPFISSLVKIHAEGGISWRHPVDGTHHLSPVLAPIMIADAPARAGVLHMQEHQSKYACNACEQKTNKLPAPPAVLGEKRKIRKRRFLFKEEPAQLRSHESMAMQGRIASERGVPKRGCKGKTVVENIPLVDLSTYVLAEYMHCVISGVVEQICSLWFFSKGEWYIGNHITEINKFLCTEIYPPDYVSRLPRSLDNFTYFKANEFRSFFLYYSLIVVFPYLPDKYFQHWMILVEAMFLLLSDSISEQDLTYANAMIRLFLRDLGSLYGDEQYTYNMHQMNHMVLYTRRWGCLWATSAFGFESFNGTLAKMIHGSKHEGKQLINSMFLAQASQILETKIMISAKTDKIITCRGKPLSRPLSEEELSCLSNFETGEEPVLLHSRISIGRETYSSEEYEKNFKRRNSFVHVNYNGQKLIGRIIVFVKIRFHVVCLLSVHRVVHEKFFFHRDTRTRVKHIIPVEKTKEIVACKVQDIEQKLIQVGNYVCYRPNAIESNL